MRVSRLRLIPRELGSGRELTHTGMIKLPVPFKIRNICCSQDWLTSQVHSRLARAALINGLAIAAFQGTEGENRSVNQREKGTNSGSENPLIFTKSHRQLCSLQTTSFCWHPALAACSGLVQLVTTAADSGGDPFSHRRPDGEGLY